MSSEIFYLSLHVCQTVEFTRPITFMIDPALKFVTRVHFHYVVPAAMIYLPRALWNFSDVREGARGNSPAIVCLHDDAKCTVHVSDTSNDDRARRQRSLLNASVGSASDVTFARQNLHQAVPLCVKSVRSRRQNVYFANSNNPSIRERSKNFAGS